MDKAYQRDLAKVRQERAQELLDEAKELLDKGAYKSANNRAYYAVEKSIKALLATKEIDAFTHNGVLKQFNYFFIYQGDNTFTAEDYQIIAQSEQIRNASDYDDFYIAVKDESQQQVENAGYIVGKVERYLKNER
ncbi:MAG: HEPN domain-containing protein [Lachnospiraceae bacterium]|jgi:uncharacterized protein (UPF0332 family)|nr:HEPN domain-containing protein [Lachnospiraceae bacterium]